MGNSIAMSFAKEFLDTIRKLTSNPQGVRILKQLGLYDDIMEFAMDCEFYVNGIIIPTYLYKFHIDMLFPDEFDKRRFLQIWEVSNANS